MKELYGLQNMRDWLCDIESRFSRVRAKVGKVGNFGVLEKRLFMMKLVGAHDVKICVHNEKDFMRKILWEDWCS